MIINNSTDAITLCEKENLSLFELALAYEKNNSALSEEKIYTHMANNFSAMKQSIRVGLEDNSNHKIKPKMFSGYGHKMLSYYDKGNAVSGSVMAKAVTYALSVMEVNCSMGKIVACPTAGSCGVVPAALMSVIESQNIEEKKAIEGLFVCGLIGSIIAKHASLSGAMHGCQAEIGSAAAMAAGAIIYMKGGSPKMAFEAGAIALKNLMGLVCDPVAGLVESPCVKRNAIGVSNALICVDMVMAGIESIIPFDDVVYAMDKVGKSMPARLRETAEGGVADTPTGRKLARKLNNKS